MKQIGMQCTLALPGTVLSCELVPWKPSKLSMMMLVSPLQMEKTRHREVKQLAQSPTACARDIWDSDPSGLAPPPQALNHRHHQSPLFPNNALPSPLQLTLLAPEREREGDGLQVEEQLWGLTI